MNPISKSTTSSRMHFLYLILVGSIISALYIGCASLDHQADSSLFESDYLVRTDGKYDTGYYSDLAMELEGDFEGLLELDVTELDEQKIESLHSQSVLAIIAEKQI